ncbi:MAG: prepilin-type N-terminal cleavage/methylation domain-containing protein [Pseudomonadota bacterium]
MAQALTVETTTRRRRGSWKRSSGFSLIELSIVILVMGLLLGGLLAPLSVQRENARLTSARHLLSEVESALFGYALANGALPCPATPASAGAAALAGGGCVAQHGFVPAATLGLRGQRNTDGLLLDPWSSPLRYSVSSSDVDTDGAWDFVVPGEMRDVTVASLIPDLIVCTTTVGSTPTACGSAGNTLTSSAPFVAYSLGKDWGSSSGAEQQENLGASLGGGPSSTSYAIAGDVVFTSREHSAQSGAEYDDIVHWGSALTLYQQLLTTGQLP